MLRLKLPVKALCCVHFMLDVSELRFNVMQQVRPTNKIQQIINDISQQVQIRHDLVDGVAKEACSTNNMR